MRQVAVLILAACAVGQVWAQKGDKSQNFTMEDFLAKGYRVQPTQTIDYDAVMKRLNAIPTPPEPPKRELGMIDRWRFESCMTDAAKAPTEFGVRAGLRVCREKFGQ